LRALVARPEVGDAFQVPWRFLLMQLAENNDYFLQELGCHLPQLLPEVLAARRAAERYLPRPLSDELHADRHHRAALLFENVTRFGGLADAGRWQRLLDGVFLHPRWGLVGSLAVFALVLLMVFKVSTMLDGWTAAPLVEWAQLWQPASTAGVVGRAVLDGLIGLVGIVIPYMLPLVLLLVALEESGIMHRVAFVVDRGFHRIGLHGGVAAPFLVGWAATCRRSRWWRQPAAARIASWPPCCWPSFPVRHARQSFWRWAASISAALGVFAIFALTFVVLTVLGGLLAGGMPTWRSV
jgi:ferrous iron transport protein B